MAKQKPTPKRWGYGLEVKTATNKSGTYLVFRAPPGSFHVLQEVEAKKAFESFGIPREKDGKKKNTRQMGEEFWKKY